MTEIQEVMALRSGALDALVFADASHSHETLCGGWAAWILVPKLPAYAVQGPLPHALRSSTEAEMQALAAGVRSAQAHLKRGAKVMVLSDSQNALRWVLNSYDRAADWPSAGGLVLPQPKMPTPISRQSEGLARFLGACEDLDLTIFTRHVAAHQVGMSWAHTMNHRCDRLAFNQRRAAEHRLKGAT